MKRIIHGENLAALAALPEGFAQLVYLDPPFNTGARVERTRVKAKQDRASPRIGFQGVGYSLARGKTSSYADAFDDYLAFLMPRIEACLRCMTKDGSLFVHLDAREVHYVKVALDGLLGRSAFMNEIIWAYDYGGRSKKCWPRKHDTLLWYARDPGRFVFHHDAIDRIPYLAPKLVGADKAARGKTPTDVWWHTIVPTSGKEKTGYPTQKPLGILRRIVEVHSDPGAVVLDAFAGSGTTGEAAARAGRGFVLIDERADAVRVMKKRLAPFVPEVEKLDGKRQSARASRASAVSVGIDKKGL